MQAIDFGELVDRFAMSVARPEIYRAHIHDTATSLVPGKPAAIVIECDAYAERLHHGQLRGDGSPYIVHPRRVALMAAAVCSDEVVHQAFLIGLLHDVVEDCGVGTAFIEEQYGPEVARAVSVLTAVPSTHETKEERFARKRDKWSRVAASDLLTITVHLMDVLDNCISWRMVEPEMSAWRKIPRWLWQTLEFQVPLADEHLPVVGKRLRDEITFQQRRGIEVGSWKDA